MKIPRAIQCSKAIAEAVRLCKPEVIAAYPITPQTLIVEELAKMHADGKLQAEFINVESEHSALSICIGAEATGCRTFTATSSQGLALMHEMLFIASGLRLPIVMVTVNRALSAPLNIWCDHSDTMASRDSGWIQLYCESVQEAHDTVLQAYKIAEQVLLPVMVCIDGFTLSHVSENVELLNEKQVSSFLPTYKPNYILDPKKPVTMGSVAFPDNYWKFKVQQQNAMKQALEVIKKVNSEFKEKFYRVYGNGLIETFNMQDTNQAVIALGSQCSTIKHVLQGQKTKKVGLIRIKSFRPFPKKELQTACKNLKRIDVIDRAISLGSHAPLYTEVKAILQDNVKINSHILGLGGQDITPRMIKKLIK
ncbi:MAG: pyruvate ferredoxin oxidoreductase [Candidatus Pacearchaeota archaeon]